MKAAATGTSGYVEQMLPLPVFLFALPGLLPKVALVIWVRASSEVDAALFCVFEHGCDGQASGLLR